MRSRDFAIGSVLLLVVLLFLFFVLRSCSSSSTQLSPAAVTVDSVHLTTCTADPETGLCFPEKNTPETFDWEQFMALVRAHQSSASSSSSFSSRGQPSGSLLARLAGQVGSSVAGRSSRASRTSFSIQCVDYCPGSSSVSSSLNPYSSPGVFRSSSSSSVRNWFLSRSSSFFGGGSDGGRRSGSGTIANGTGGFVGYHGLQGSRGPLPTGRCLRSRSLLSIFNGEMASGTFGWTFPVLIDGSCPISATMLKWRDSGNGFGGPLNDF